MLSEFIGKTQVRGTVTEHMAALLDRIEREIGDDSNGY